MISDAQLLELNQQGLVPGPNETEAQFVDRTQRCIRLKESIVIELKEHVPFVQEELNTFTPIHQALSITKCLYDISPTWIPLFFSNKSLAPWHGGCAWIFQLEQQSPPMAFLQLRREFANQETFLGLYHRDELIAHELSHVGRMAFEEPKYEEMLSYRTADSKLRRWLGPLLQSSHEASILVAFLFLCIVVDAIAFFVGGPQTFLAAQSWKLLPLAYLIYLLGRLWWRHYVFNRCKRHLFDVFGDEHRADSVIYRLTDGEIAHLGTLSTQDVQIYAQEQSSLSVRWRLLWVAYFKDVKGYAS